MPKKTIAPASYIKIKNDIYLIQEIGKVNVLKELKEFHKERRKHGK